VLRVWSWWPCGLRAEHQVVKPCSRVESPFFPYIKLGSSVMSLSRTGVVVVGLRALHNLSIHLNSTFNKLSKSI
jgi:hypothetical protein